MNFQVTNKQLTVGAIRIISVESSSVILIGDTQTIACSSIAQTAPGETVIPVQPGATPR